MLIAEKHHKFCILVFQKDNLCIEYSMESNSLRKKIAKYLIPITGVIGWFGIILFAISSITGYPDEPNKSWMPIFYVFCVYAIILHAGFSFELKRMNWFGINFSTSNTDTKTTELKPRKVKKCKIKLFRYLYYQILMLLDKKGGVEFVWILLTMMPLIFTILLVFAFLGVKSQIMFGIVFSLVLVLFFLFISHRVTENKEDIMHEFKDKKNNLMKFVLSIYTLIVVSIYIVFALGYTGKI